MDVLTESTFDIRDIIWQARRYRWLIAFPIVAALCVAFVYYRMTIPVYESSVVVSVGDRARLSPGLEALTRSDRDAYQSVRDRQLLLDNRVHGRGFLATLVERIGFGRSPEEIADARELVKRWKDVSPEEYAQRTAVTRLGRKIQVYPIQGQLCRIVVTDPSPMEAQKIANALAELLVEQSRQVSLQRAQARGAFSADQIAVYQERLRHSEDALRAYQESLIGRNLSTSLVNDNNLDLARSLLRVNREEMDQIRSRLSSERARWRDTTGGTEAPPDLVSTATGSLESRLIDLEANYASAQLGGERTTSDAAALKTRIAETRQALLAEYEQLAATVLGDRLEGVQAIACGIALDGSILRTLREKERRLAGQITAFSQAVRNSPRDQMELERLRSELETNRQLLATLQKEVTSSRLSEALETSDLGITLDVVESAQIPLSPVSPSGVKIFGGALVLGPAIALALILAIEKLGATLRTLEQAEKEIGVAVVGTIPRVEGWSRPGSFLQNNWAPLFILIVVLLTGIFYTVQRVMRAEQPRPPAAAMERP